MPHVFCSNYPYNTCLKSLIWSGNISNLCYRRKLTRLTLFHKFYFNQFTATYYIIPCTRFLLRLRHPLRVYYSTPKTLAFLNSFFIPTAIECNDHPLTFSLTGTYVTSKMPCKLTFSKGIFFCVCHYTFY